MYACDYLENGVLNALRAVTFAAPANCYLALYLNDPGENGLGGTEVSYTGYRRMKIDFSAPADSNSGLGIQNVADIAFPTPVSAAGTITHIGVLDSLAGGNMLARGELVEPLVIGANEPPVFLAGDVLFYLTGNLSKAWKTKVLNVFRGTSIQGVTPYFSLWNGSPETSGSELSGDNYQRVPLTFGAPAEQASGQIVARNSAAAAFPRPSTLWGTWTYSVLYSTEISGEPVFIKPLTEAIELKRGYMPTIAEGAVEGGYQLMYSDKRYSLTRFSVNRENRALDIRENFSEVLGAVAGAAVPVDFRDRFSETAQLNVRGTVSVVSAFSALAELTAARPSADVVSLTAFGEVLHGAAHGKKNTPAALEAAEILTAYILSAKNTPAVTELAEKLTARIAGSKNVQAALTVSEVLTSMLEATSQITERTTVQLTIPPGAELRIDSELFLVLLDGENVLHTQSGDWINVSRDLLRIIVESASGGNLRGQLIYTERYL